MIVFPNAKINLGLSVVEKRADGYHNLETVFYPVALKDALEAICLPADSPSVVLHQYGHSIAGAPEENLVVRAYHLLAQSHRLPPVEIHLYKHIPSGAGLGGGSADAAFALQLFNRLGNLQLPDEHLEHLAASLGADCAFFIRNRPTFAQGIGNLFSPLSLSLAGYGILIVKPNIFVSTREAFARIRPHRPLHSVKEVVQLPVAQWKDVLVNDFEKSVFPQYPAIGEIKETLYHHGSLYASMSGSGSAVFGLFAPGRPLPKIKWPEAYFCFEGVL